ncbi:MAG: exonuclease SbcCD subunit D [Anaerolineae bacterium]|nr:exonuclease SbcCD subunit D [Anaerolineae bacterium]
MIKLLHFADAHIDMASQGRRDAQSGLPIRVLDFLAALDTIVDTAISEQVDVVLFAGDAYKDRTPSPTFQREWERRIMRLSQAGIRTILVIGNHDLSPAFGRAHALQEFDTLKIPHVSVISRACLLKPQDLDGLALQVIGLPWITRSALMAAQELSAASHVAINEAIETYVQALIPSLLDQTDPDLPLVLTAHASVEGATYGAERSVMLGGDLVLPISLMQDKRLDYVALGHIHKAQNLSPDGHHPIIYSGSIERVDWGEARDDKSFVIVHLEKGQKTRIEWRQLQGRRFIDCRAEITSDQQVLQSIMAALPNQQEMADSIVRLVIEYPRHLESMIDEQAIRQYTQDAFEFHFIRRPKVENRFRLPEDQAISQMEPAQLLNLYLQATKTSPEDATALSKLAQEIFNETS